MSYREIFDRFNRETRHLSFTDKNHPCFGVLVRMGKPIIPLILEDIGKDDKAVMNGIALINEILRIEDLAAVEIPKQHRGRIALLREDFLRWGHENGYI